MSQLTRPLVATLTLLVLWFLLGMLEAIHAPDWAVIGFGAVSLGNLIVLMASVHQLTRERDRGDGYGGLTAGRPDAPESGGGEPSWWPEFERELAQHLAEQAPADHVPERAPVGAV